MTVNFCGCIRRELIVVQVIEGYLHKQYKCRDCGRMFFEQEKLLEDIDDLIDNTDNE